jgi:hypothetical protein
VVLLHAIHGAWGKRRYSPYSFLSSVIGGVSGQHHASATLYPREIRPLYPEPAWMQRLEKKFSVSVEDETPVAIKHLKNDSKISGKYTK